MKLSEDYTDGSYVIRAYSQNAITVNNREYQSSLLLANHTLQPDWPVQHIEQITPQHWQQILELQPQVIIIGTGDRIQFPHPSTYATVIEQGIGVEFMDSMAACRTYNILLSEDRSVVAGIIL